MHNDEEFMMFGEDTIGRDRGFDIESMYEANAEDEFIDDERDFEDVDDLDELLAVDKEVEDIIHDNEDIPEEDLRESVFEDEEAESEEDEEYDEDEDEEIDEDDLIDR